MGREQEMIEGARCGDYSVVERILSQRAKRSGPLASLRRGPGVNAQDASGYTSLHHAALNGHKDIVALLLQHEASTNVTDTKGSTPLHLAAWTGNTDIVHLLLEQGPSVPNVNLQNHDQETALHSAAQYGHTEVVAMLLKHESDPGVRNIRGETPLDLAAQYGRLESVELLVRCSGSPPSSPRLGPSPLHLASRNGHRPVVRILLAHGFDVNCLTENGSALHEAALYGKIEVVRLLLENGIDVNLEDSQRRTVFDLLNELNTSNAKQIAKIVEEYTTVSTEGSSYSIQPGSRPSSGGSPRQLRQHSPLIGSSDKLVSPQFPSTNGPRPCDIGGKTPPSSNKPQPPVKPPRRSIAPVSPGNSETGVSPAPPLQRLPDLQVHHPSRPVPNGGSPFSALYDEVARVAAARRHGGERPPKPPKPNSLDLKAKRATVQIPLSPTHYRQPPTPEFSPPSPATAVSGIHDKIRPLSLNDVKEEEEYPEPEICLELEYRGKRLSRNMETLTDENLFIDAAGNVKITLRKENKSVSTDTIEEIVEDDPFAGLCRGSVYHNGTAAGVAENGSSGGGKKRGSDSSLLSPFDENSEWAEIADIMASFGGGLARESVFAREMEEHFTRALASNKKASSVKIFKDEVPYTTVAEWLSSIGLCQYMTDFISNGFDDIHFLCSNIMEEKDLKEIGVTDPEHRKKILASTREFPVMVPVGTGEGCAGMPDSVDHWLSLLNLTQYQETFRQNGFTDMPRVLRLWDLELNTILEVNLLGHRNRILTSVGEGYSELDGLDDLDLSKLEWTLSDLAVPSPIPPLTAPKPLPRPPDDGDLKIRPPPQLMGAPGTVSLRSPQQLAQDAPAILSSAAEWRHQSEALVKGACNYKAQYLGSTLVKELKGVESTRKSILKMKSSTREIGKIPNVILSISSSGVKFIDGHTKNQVCEHEIRNIHCACQDADDLNHFAYITKEHHTNNHYCHVFCAQSRDLATEIILTLGQAFEVAYQLALRDKPLPPRRAPCENKSDDQKIAEKSSRFVSHVTVQLVNKSEDS